MGTISLFGVRTLSRTVNINTWYNLSDFFQFFPATTTRISNSDGSVYAASITFLDPSASLPNNGFRQIGFNLRESTYQDTGTSNGTHDYGIYATVDGYQSAGNYAPYAINFSSIQIEFTTAGRTALSVDRFPGFAIYENAQTPDGRYSVSSVVPEDFSGVVTVIGNNSLFTSGSDTVDFNNFSASQKSAVTQPGVDIYHTGDGDDVVKLPTNTSNIAGLGISYNQPLVLGGGTDTVYGSSAATSVTLGTGPDAIVLGTGAMTLTFQSGSGTAILVPSSSGRVMQVTVAGFGNGSTIDFRGMLNLTFSTSYEGNAATTASVYSGATLLANITFASGFDNTNVEPEDDGSGGTKLVVDTRAAPSIQDPTAGNSIQWSFIHQNEGGSYLAPYVPQNQKPSTA